MKKIYIIEDNEKVKSELIILLEKYGYECESSNDFKNIISDCLESNPHLILLDITLPEYDGYHICREIRKISSIPIIIVTSRDNEFDELMSMNLGADDYITKPYNTQILLAHISSVLNRTYNSQNQNIIEYKNVILDINKSIVKYLGNEIELTKNELRILNYLMENKDRIVPRDDIMNYLWQTNEFVDDNTLTVNINRLRKKLDEIGINDFLITKRGQGYIV